MSAPPGSRPFAETTRGRIIERLRRGARTVDELAQELGLTDNAVRAHLATLERDDMVGVAGSRRGGGAGKPAILYEASAEAEAALSHAYVPLLQALLSALDRRLTPAQLRALFRDAGRRLAAGRPTAGGSLRDRAAFAAAVLDELGGSASVEPAGAGYQVVGCGCPASLAVAEQPAVCIAVETMLQAVTGAEVRRQCEHGPRPQCRFEVSAAR